MNDLGALPPGRQGVRGLHCGDDFYALGTDRLSRYFGAGVVPEPPNPRLQAHDCSHEAGAVAFPVPVLTVGGEPDGVVRIGRVAEAVHTQRNETRLPVVVVGNMTHSTLLANVFVAVRPF